MEYNTLWFIRLTQQGCMITFYKPGLVIPQWWTAAMQRLGLHLVSWILLRKQKPPWKDDQVPQNNILSQRWIQRRAWEGCNRLLSIAIFFCYFFHTSGWFHKISIPNHTWYEYFKPPLPSEIPKRSIHPPHALRISKSLTPPPVRNFRLFFSDPLEILFNCLKFLTNGKHLGSHLPPELNPLASYAVGIPHWGTSPCLQNSSPWNPPSPSEFQDAARGIV